MSQISSPLTHLAVEALLTGNRIQGPAGLAQETLMPKDSDLIRANVRLHEFGNSTRGQSSDRALAALCSRAFSGLIELGDHIKYGRAMGPGWMGSMSIVATPLGELKSNNTGSFEKLVSLMTKAMTAAQDRNFTEYYGLMAHSADAALQLVDTLES